MYQTEQMILFFKDETQSHSFPELSDSPINHESTQERYRLAISTSLVFRASLASLGDYGTSLNIMRIGTCVDQPGLEFRLVLPLQQIRKLEHSPASASWQISTRPAYSEIHCGNNAALFAIIHYCTNFTISLNPVDPVTSHLSDAMPFFEDIKTGSCMENAYKFTESYNTRTKRAISDVFYPSLFAADEHGTMEGHNWTAGVAVKVYHE